MGAACSMHGEIRNTYTILLGKPEGKGVRRSKFVWEGNIKKSILKSSVYES
jgi:hypothetical protein